MTKPRCRDFTAGGFPCCLPAGHHGEHQTGPYEVFYMAHLGLTLVRPEGEQTWNEQCRATCHGRRCIRPFGHDGPHWSGAPAAKREVTWTTPDRERRLELFNPLTDVHKPSPPEDYWTGLPPLDEPG